MPTDKAPDKRSGLSFFQRIGLLWRVGTTVYGIVRFVIIASAITWAGYAIRHNKAVMHAVNTQLSRGLLSKMVPTPKQLVGAIEDEILPGHQVGYVAVRSKPAHRIHVWVDGQEIGKGPMALRQMECGTHKIDLIGEGRETKHLEVTVTPLHTRKAPLVISED